MIDYWATWVSGNASANDDAAAACWVTIRDLDSYDLLPDSRAVIQKAHELWHQAAEFG